MVERTSRLKNKFLDCLLQKKKNNVANIKFRYFVKQNPNIVQSNRLGLRSSINVTSNHNKFSFSLTPFHNTSNNFFTTIMLDPKSFSESLVSPFRLQDKWFKNLSSVDIPLTVRGFLQLGPNFCMPN